MTILSYFSQIYRHTIDKILKVCYNIHKSALRSRTKEDMMFCEYFYYTVIEGLEKTNQAIKVLTEKYHAQFMDKMGHELHFKTGGHVSPEEQADLGIFDRFDLTGIARAKSAYYGHTEYRSLRASDFGLSEDSFDDDDDDDDYD